MSALTDKLEAQIRHDEAAGRYDASAWLHAILDDVRELERRADDAEQAAIGSHAMRMDDIRMNAVRGLDEAGQSAAIRTAKREAYEHALQCIADFEANKTDVGGYAAIQAAIDMIDAQEVDE